MKITKAVVTAANRKQRTLPLRTLIESDAVEKPVLSIRNDSWLGERPA